MGEAAVKLPGLEALRALAAKKPLSPTSPLAIQHNDPAIAGAKREKNTVRLGFDPGIAEDAEYAASLKQALERAEADFTIAQAKMRDYGKSKRDLYNDTFKSNITTVCIPYTIEVPNDQNGNTPGRETKYIQCICSNKYSVQVETILNNKETFGDTYDKLFNEETQKVLKPNADNLIRQVLVDCGMKAEELDLVMDSLFDVKVKVTTSENFESEAKKTPPDIQAILAQAVTRSQPGLKF